MLPGLGQGSTESLRGLRVVQLISLSDCSQEEPVHGWLEGRLDVESYKINKSNTFAYSLRPLLQPKNPEEDRTKITVDYIGLRFRSGLRFKLGLRSG